MRNIKNYITGKSKYGEWVRFSGFFLKSTFVPDFMALTEGERSLLIDLMESPRILPFHVDAVNPFKNKLEKLARTRLIIKTKMHDMNIYAPNPTIVRPPKAYGAKR